MARALREKRVHTGVLICGSGIGISIAANGILRYARRWCMMFAALA